MLTFNLLQLKDWFAKGGYALGDQVVFGAAHFFLSIFLARWLSPYDYGAFTLGYSAFHLVAGAHSALLLEPMLVLGSGRFLAYEGTYFRMVIRAHLIFTGSAGLLMVLLFYPISLFYEPSVGSAFAFFGLAMPVLLLFWTVRRLFYVNLRLGWAMMGSLVYCLAIIIMLYYGFVTNVISLPWAVASMAFAASAAVLFLIAPLRKRLKDRAPITITFSRFVHDHWDYGRWALASSFVLWIPLNIPYLVLPLAGGIDDTAAFRAMMNLVNPALQVIAALTLVLIPKLVRDLHDNGFQHLTRTMKRFLLPVVILVSLYFLLLLLYKKELFRIFYDGQYSDYADGSMAIIGAVMLLAAFTQTLGAAIRAMELPKRVCGSYAVAAAVALLFGVPLAFMYDVRGAAFGLFLSYLVIVVMLFVHYNRVTRSKT
jgi:O-antigen/teichoic acid export membrane protein